MKETTKKRLTITATVLLTVMVIYAVLALVTKPQNYRYVNGMMKEGELPLLIAHGGGNKEFPDNTLEAFYNAYSVDKNVMMETDVSITADGVVILSHDTTIDRKTNRTGKIAEWNYSDLIAERVDFSYTNETTEDEALVEGSERVKFKNEAGREVTPTDVEYPAGVTARDENVFLATTLEELLVAFPENRINVEIKQEGELGKKALAAVIELLEKYDAFDRVVLASFHSEIYNEFRRLQKDGGLPKGVMYSPGTSGVIKYFILKTVGLDVFFTDGICVFQLPMEEVGISLATRSLVNNAHEHNVAVHYWTINDEEDMRYLVSIGADGIMTDYPHRLAAVYAEYASAE